MLGAELYVLYLVLVFHSSASLYTATASGLSSHSYSRSDALNKFFDSIDQDGDGQIQAAEASQYIDATFDEHELSVNPTKAAQQMSSKLDGSDPDATVSKEEVEKHLKRLLKGNRLAEWLRNSAQMPQYVQSFKDNAVTSLDFPSLIADGGELLEKELGVKSKLHREQMVRAMQRLLLGLGESPSVPERFEARAVQCNAVSLSWQPPAKMGQPSLHKYKLDRLKLGQEGKPVGAWELVSDNLDDETHSHVDAGVQAATYIHRLVAWNAVGGSDPAISPPSSTANLSLPCPPGSCWRLGTCKGQPVSSASFSQQQRPNVVLGGWRLIASLLGVLLLGYSLVVFSTGKDFQQEFLAGLGLTRILSSSEEQQPHSAEKSREIPDVNPGLPAMEQRLREVQASRSFSEQLSLQPLRVSTDACRSCKTFKEGQPQMGSPSRKAWTPPSRSDFFSPGDIGSFRGLAPQPLKGGLSPVAVGDGSPLGPSSSSQQVLWLDDEGQEVEAPPALDIPPSPKDTGRHGCAFPSCEKGLHPIFNPRSAITSHYCSICQSVFCYRHTRYSPHGKLGSCGMESKCICSLCFNDLPRITQERLERTNKLQQKPRKESGVQNSGGSSSSKEKDRRKTTSARYSSTQSLASHLDSPLGKDERRLSNVPSLGRSGAANWSKLRTAWRAVQLFQGAGNDRRRRSDGNFEPLREQRDCRKTR